MTDGTISARGRLLRRGRRRDVEGTQLALELGGVEASAGGEPVARGELEVAVAGPVRQDAEQVAEVGLGIEAVETSGGDQREQVAGGLGVVVAADEQPRLSADGDPAQLALRFVVGQLESTVVEEASEGAALAMGVAEGRAQHAALALDPLVSTAKH